MKKLFVLLVLFPFLASAQATSKWNQAILEWKPSTVCADPLMPPSSCPSTGYKVYQQQADSTWKSVAGVTGLMWTTPDLAAGTYCWRVTPLNGTIEGPPTNSSCKTIPAAPPPSAPGVPINFTVK